MALEITFKKNNFLPDFRKLSESDKDLIVIESISQSIAAAIGFYEQTVEIFRRPALVTLVKYRDKISVRIVEKPVVGELPYQYGCLRADCDTGLWTMYHVDVVEDSAKQPTLTGKLTDKVLFGPVDDDRAIMELTNVWSPTRTTVYSLISPDAEQRVG